MFVFASPRKMMSACSSLFDFHCKNLTSVKSQEGNWLFVVDICVNFFNFHSSFLSFSIWGSRWGSMWSQEGQLYSLAPGVKQWIRLSKLAHSIYLVTVIRYLVGHMTSQNLAKISFTTLARIAGSRTLSLPSGNRKSKTLSHFTVTKQISLILKPKYRELQRNKTRALITSGTSILNLI